MTKIKLCGLTRPGDIAAANELKPEFVGFVFAAKSRRYVSSERAKALKRLLIPEIKAVGVFVNESPEQIAKFLNQGIIDIVQLHGREDESTISHLRRLTDHPIIKAFRVDGPKDIDRAKKCSADYVLLDAGKGEGRVFDWHLIKNFNKPFFLAGGLSPENVKVAIKTLHPFAVDVSSGIETAGIKDKTKMAAFVAAVRKEETT